MQSIYSDESQPSSRRTTIPEAHAYIRLVPAMEISDGVGLSEAGTQTGGSSSSSSGGGGAFSDAPSPGASANRLRDGMATALSLDFWEAPPSSACRYDGGSPELSVNFLCMHPPEGLDEGGRGAPPLLASARFQEIFVDLCSLHASSLEAASRHVLDSRFDSFLGEGEREFKRAVLDLVGEGGRGGMRPEARQTSAYRALEGMLRKEMGLGALGRAQEKRVQKMRYKRRGSATPPLNPHHQQNQQQQQQNQQQQRIRRNLSTVASKLSLADRSEPGELCPKGVTLQGLAEHIRSNERLFRLFSLLNIGSKNSEDSPERHDAVGRLTEALQDGRLLEMAANDGQSASNVAATASEWDPKGLAKVIMNSYESDDGSGNDCTRLQRQQELKAFRRLLRPPGHVFVANASVCDISCDAFLCPGRISKKKGTIAGSIWKRWYDNAKKSPKLLEVLRGNVTGATLEGTNIDQNLSAKERRRRLNPARSNSASESEGDAKQKQKQKQAKLPTRIPMKRYDQYDRVVSPKHWPWNAFTENENLQIEGGIIPAPFIGEVSHDILLCKSEAEENHIDALMVTVRQFVSVSLAELRKKQPFPRANRERYLLALPVVGTGGGQAGDLTGQVVEAMTVTLSQLVATNDDVDCVIVCADLATFSHAQNVRLNLCHYLDPKECSHNPDDCASANKSRGSARRFDTSVTEPLSSFRLFPEEMRSNAFQLAQLAVKGDLSFLLGAGVGIPAGLPSWTNLLVGIEDQFTANGLPSERMLGRAAAKAKPLPTADWLDILASSKTDRNGVHRDIKERIATFIKERSQFPSLLMSLLASIPCKSIVTQNYDMLCERAFECRNLAEKEREQEAGEEVVLDSLSVIPHRPVKGAGRWLLKMHGCVSSPESIVVTSADYRNYESGRKKALAGLVQANLMTSHLLIVGYSLTDPNYHRIVEEVREALKPGLGTP